MTGIRVLAIGWESNVSFRLRVQQYETLLHADGLHLTSVLLPQTSAGRLRRFGLPLWREARAADVVIVQRVLLRWLNALLRMTRTPVVLDLDDAVHYVRSSQLAAAEQPRRLGERALIAYRRAVRGGRFFSSRKRLLDELLSIARVAVLGNDSLAADLKARARCPIVVIPTSTPADRALVKRHESHTPVTLGWIGTRDNLLHLRLLEPVFRELAATDGDSLRLHVVTSQAYRSDHLRTEFTPWSLEKETELVRGFDVGVMPLVDDFFSRGKCAFKAILCMSFGVPVVISPVGINARLVRDGWNGFLASTPAEWSDAITALTRDPELRARLGRNAFETIESDYSVARAYPELRRAIESAAGRRGRSGVQSTE